MKASVLTPFRSRNGKVFQVGDVIDTEPEKVEILVRDGLVTPLSDDGAPVLPHCSGCARFIPDPVNPPAGYGECGVTGKGFFPAPRPGCNDYLLGTPLSMVEGKGETEILFLLTFHRDGLTFDSLLERLPLSRRELGRSLAILQGKHLVESHVRGFWGLYTMKQPDLPLEEAETVSTIFPLMEGN